MPLVRDGRNQGGAEKPASFHASSGPWIVDGRRRYGWRAIFRYGDDSDGLCPHVHRTRQAANDCGFRSIR